jgi:hypothetical protein
LLRELSAKAIGALLRCLHLYLIAMLEAYQATVFVDVTLFLGERNMTFGYASGVIHTLGEQHSLFLVELFTSVHWRLWLIPVLGRTRLKTLKELKRAYSNALVV